MALRPLLRGVVALVVLGGAAVAIRTRAPMIDDHGVMAFRLPRLMAAPVCAGDTLDPRQMVARAADAIMRHLLRHTMLAGLVRTGPEAIQAHMIRLRRCALEHSARAYHMRIATSVIGEGAGLDVRIAPAPGEFEADGVRPAAWAQRFFGAVGRDVLVRSGKTRPVLLITGGAAGQAGAVAGFVARAMGASARDVYFRTVLPQSADRGFGGFIEIAGFASKAALQAYIATLPAARLPMAPVMRVADGPHVPASGFGFGGSPVGLGTPIDLGGSGGWSLFGLIGSADAARPVIMPACIDGAAPAQTAPVMPRVAATPIRKFLPQFYGAPWTARAGASLVAVLDDYAPRDKAKPVPPPKLRIYRGWFAGDRGEAAYAQAGQAMIYRGATARLYRIYAPAPLVCIDIIDRRGSSLAGGTIYYRRGGRLFEVTTMFRIAQ